MVYQLFKTLYTYISKIHSILSKSFDFFILGGIFSDYMHREGNGGGGVVIIYCEEREDKNWSI